MFCVENNDIDTCGKLNHPPRAIGPPCVVHLGVGAYYYGRGPITTGGVYRKKSTPVCRALAKEEGGLLRREGAYRKNAPPKKGKRL